MNKHVLLSGLPILSLLIAGTHQVSAQVVLDQLIDSATLINGRGLACTNGPGGTTRENQYARAYDLSLCPTTGHDLLITNVTFGVEVNDMADYEVDVNIYVDVSVDPDPPLTTLVLLGSSSVTIPIVLLTDPDPTRLFVADFTGSPLYIPADIIMVVELFFPDRLGEANEGNILPGFNELGETDSGYFKSVTCGFTSFDTFESNGWFDNQFIQVVTGDRAEQLAPCPADCSLSDGNVDVNDLLNMLAGWGLTGQPCDIADGDDDVNVNDLLLLLAAWGPCATRPPFCPGDTDGNDVVDVLDLLAVLSDWGSVVCTMSDIDISGFVDVLDLLDVLAGWGPCP